MKIRPHRSARLCFRVAAACAAAVLLTAGLAVVPARAASVALARGTASVPGLSALVNSASPREAPVVTTAATDSTGPIVASFDFTSYDPAETTAAVDYWWPESLGLPDNSPLGSLLASTWSVWNGQSPPSDWLPPQPQAADFSGASISVASDGGTGSILTLSVPAPPGAGTTSGGDVNPAIAGIAAELAGGLAAAGTFMVCGAFLFGIPNNDSLWRPDYGNARQWTKLVCNSALTGAWAAVATITNYFATSGNAPSSKFPYASLVGLALGGLSAGYGFPYAGALVKVLQYAWVGLQLWIGSTRSLVNVFFPYLTPAQQGQLLELLESFTLAQLQAIGSPIGAARLFGLWTPAASGYVGNAPTGALVTAGSGDCLDAYGSNGNNEPAAPPALPGHPVAINTCNGNQAQVFTFWPNGQIEVWGLCMDDDGDTNPSDIAAVNLQVCDGGYTQLWYENSAGEIVNGATGNCLDDPYSNTTPGTQLITFPCSGALNQLWVPPGGQAAVKGFGAMFSVLSLNNLQACQVPQTTLPDPVDSEIYVGFGAYCDRTNLPDMWALGSNGTLMANGTNALCMDPAGPAVTGPDGKTAAYTVTLQRCDGTTWQVWNVQSTYRGPILKNAADGLCLTTSKGGLSYFDIMVVANCPDIPYSGELWTLPGFSVPSGLKILPFGDSITYGIDSSTGGGYRCDLLSDLASLGTDTEMVGSQVAGDCAQPDNEGHSGWTIEGLQSIENCTITGYEPNVVLLDAGTNDVNVNTPSVIVDGGDPTHAANALESLVTSIRNDDPGVVVVVGGLIPTPVAQTAANMTSFNQQVSAWISQQQGAGWHVGWADMSAVTTSDLADGLHPNDTGYQLMATAWNAAIDDAEADGWVQTPNTPSGSGCAAPPTSGPPAPTWQAEGLIAPGVQGYAPPLWSAQGEVAPGVQASGWTDALGQEIRFASLGYSSREDYLFIQPDSSVLGWRNDGPAPGGGYTWTSVGVVAPGIQGAGYAGPQDGQIQFVDLAGDGRADYVWVHTDGSLSVWLNSGIGSDGDPVWSSEVNADAPSGYNGSGSIQFADLDGDGKPDYLWVQPDGSIHWWKGASGEFGGFSWTDEGTIPSVGVPGSEIKFGYAFGGRQEDMLVVAPDSSVTAYVLNTTTNAWTPEGLVAPGIQGSGYTGPNDGDIDFADLSGTGSGLPGTGRDDYVWVRPDSSVMMWQNITGAGLDSQIHFADLEPGSKASADYIDISPLDGSVNAWINGGPAAGGGYSWVPDNNIFGGPPGYAGPGNGSVGNIQVANITAAGQAQPDILYIEPSGAVEAWALVEDTAVPLGTVVPAGTEGYDGSGEIQFADMTGDGLDDYLWVRPDSSVLMAQDAYPSWTSVGEIAPGVQASGWTDSPGQYIRFADITGSGRADYLFIRPDSSVLAWYNPGPSANYNWESMGLIAPGVQGSGWVTGTPGNQVEFADMNGDGLADYLWVRADSSVVMWQNTPG
ncbi:MAG TPA: ricin-type beta-trefoil lectin domain protein [Trebonia sp.]|nr:ricin-type beta-trefoil lectin domain protein [Trebonia sp.]